jgi:putative FmdB family regulatory protein
MPVYDYSCGACGTFSANRPMAEYREPQACPGCGEPAPRVLSAPHFADMSGARRVAHQTNERVAHAPGHATGHVHGPSCGCGAVPSASAAAKSFPGARPWMISH